MYVSFSVGIVLEHVVTHGVHEMSLPETHATVNKKRIV